MWNFPNFQSLWGAAFNLWGFFSTAEYDAIVVGAGAGGCPLAQTLAAAGIYTLLLERGGERPEATNLARTLDDALRGPCIDTFLSSGDMVLATGNCMGGGTTVNGGAYIEEETLYLTNMIKETGVSEIDADQIDSAFEYVRTRLAPTVKRERPGSAAEAAIQELVQIMDGRPDFNVVNMEPGQEDLIPNGVWRGHTIFSQENGQRRSADTILDRSSPNLSVRTYANVRRILFDGNFFGIPPFVEQASSSVPRARCVELDTMEKICVKKHGRIYLTASAIYSPMILERSGVGRDGKIHDNPDIGENLADRCSIAITGAYPKNLDTFGEFENPNIAALQVIDGSETETGKTLTGLYEFISVGSPNVFSYAAYQNSLLPTSLRDTWKAWASRLIGDMCVNDIDGSPLLFFFELPIPFCKNFKQLATSGCDSNMFGFNTINGTPTEKGRVIHVNGQVVVDMDFLRSPEDLETSGIMWRNTFELLDSMTGPAKPQRPCDPRTEECLAQSCPDLIYDGKKGMKDVFAILSPENASRIKLGSPSIVTPSAVEGILRNNPGISNVALGEALREENTSSYHFAGTCSFGKVVDGNFKVKGVEGLYVADASVLPTTTRVNIMATVLMLGRLAGQRAAAAFPWTE